MARYASVFPLVTTRSLARPFTYAGDGLDKGSIVSVPFGRSRRRGVVVGLTDEAPPGTDVLPVEKTLGSVPPELVDLALWIAEYYGSTPARALALVAPTARVRGRRARKPRPPVEHELVGEAAPLSLTPTQEAAVERIVAGIGTGARFLLYGATGSGKTEVYLQACAAALEQGRTAIVLVPEIALTPQTLARFRARFGEVVACLHSGLTEAERRDARERIVAGDARIVVGARSALFAPVRDLGVICLDEEHDPSYKHESDPRYDARTVAGRRAAIEGAVAVFGSATPRPESWAHLERLELGGRLAAKLPHVKVVDLRRESGYPLSAPLLRELGRIADRGGKAILLLNRRGVAPALHCRACGQTVRCPSCEVSLVLHGSRQLRCHHCGFARAAPTLCTACGSAEIVRLGAGTELLERELAERLPELTRYRLDADSAAGEGQHERILGEFAVADRAVLLGTQMVAKGHHFAGVALAAVVDADTGMLMPDFRSEERTFQLVTQLAGRSGRDAPGRVVVQTFSPDARPIMLAARHAVEEFLAGELERRELLGYPPYRHLVRLLVTGPNAAGPTTLLEELRADLAVLAHERADILGPVPLLRLRGAFRAQLIIKAKDPRLFVTHAAGLLASAARAMRRDGLAATIDVDPQSL